MTAISFYVAGSPPYRLACPNCSGTGNLLQGSATQHYIWCEMCDGTGKLIAWPAQRKIPENTSCK